jgi:hypothetical protein
MAASLAAALPHGNCRGRTCQPARLRVPTSLILINGLGLHAKWAGPGQHTPGLQWIS